MITKKMTKNAEKNKCELCDFVCSKKSNYLIHLMTAKHITKYEELHEKMPKNAEKNNDELPQFVCSKNNIFEKHLTPRKHINDYAELHKNMPKNAKINKVELPELTCRKNSNVEKHINSLPEKNIPKNAKINKVELLDLTCRKNSNVEKHINSLPEKNMPKNAKINKVELLDLTCRKNSIVEKHINSLPEKNMPKNAKINKDELLDLTCRKNSNVVHEKNIKMPQMYICSCGKEYIYRQGLYTHKRKCKELLDNIKIKIDEITPPASKNDEQFIKLLIKENTDFKNIILDVVKNNNELQKQMLEVCKNNSNTVINSHNKTFNLQVFLNEECKDAMNLTDFMNSFQLQLEDLEKVGTMGYVDGVSNIILKKLREMDVNKRPMHCSDAKREIMYIKEEDKWEKEGLNNLKLKKAITIIENKNIKLLGAWKEAHPKYMEYDEPDNDIYTHLIIQTMSNCDDFGNKVIKKLAKEVTIDKC
jgi:hypothetical protein